MEALDNQRLAVFGGFQWKNHAEIYLNDFWIFTFTSNTHTSGTAITYFRFL